MATPTEPLRVLQYAPLWGAPSLDPECTRVQAYLRFCGLLAGRDFVLEDCGPASIGELPVLAAEGLGLVSGGRIDACLCERGHDPDARLGAAQRAEAAAFSALVRHPLRLSLTYSWWAEAANYSAVIRPAYAGSLPFPVGVYLPWLMRRRATSMLARQQCDPLFGTAHVPYDWHPPTKVVEDASFAHMPSCIASRLPLDEYAPLMSDDGFFSCLPIFMPTDALPAEEVALAESVGMARPIGASV